MRFASLFFLLLYAPIASFAEVVVHNSAELADLLKTDKEYGSILLDNDVFSFEDLVVKAGVTIHPAKGRHPIFLGKYAEFIQGDNNQIGNGYWRVKVKENSKRNFYLFDENFNSIPISMAVQGNKNIRIKYGDFEKLDEKTRTIRIKIGQKYRELLHKSKNYFKNCTLKMTYWYVAFDVVDLYSDGVYLYGTVPSDYHYRMLLHKYQFDTFLTFYNYPISAKSAFIDGNDYLNIPNEYNKVFFSRSTAILRLVGNRSVTLDGITFKGSDRPIWIEKGRNKHIVNCHFMECGLGVYANNGNHNYDTNSEVANCEFKDIYSNTCLNFVGMDNVVIRNNTFRRTGIINKGGNVIYVSGQGFEVYGNNIQDFSYIGIRVSSVVEPNIMKVSGIVRDNVIDNSAQYGHAETQLIDGGAIYVKTHNDNTVISGNLIRNIGFEHGSERGIYLDDGAYNCKVLYNVIYNIYPNERAIYSRLVKGYKFHNMNNEFIGNICVGRCEMQGHTGREGEKTVIKNNYFDRELVTNQKFNKEFKGNHEITVEVKADGKLYIDKEVKIPLRSYSRLLRSYFDNSVSIRKGSL